jgi:hypothetical protein
MDLYTPSSSKNEKDANFLEKDGSDTFGSCHFLISTTAQATSADCGDHCFEKPRGCSRMMIF